MSMRAPADQRLLRRRLLRWTAPLAVLAALAGGKLLAMSGAAQVAQSSFLVGNGETAERASAILAVANVVETFKAPFAAGTVAAADARTVGDLVHAEELLREALALAIDADQCAVRYNLALVIEGRGDVAQDQAEAERLFREASAVASGAPAGCRELPPLTSRPLSDAQEQEGEADEDQAEAEFQKSQRKGRRKAG